MITGTTYRKETPAGTVRVVINTQDGDPFEVFLLLGRAGSEIQSFTEALGRVISLYLRAEGSVPPRERLAIVADQFQGLGGAHQIGFGPERVLSVVDGIGQVLAHHLAGDASVTAPDHAATTSPTHAPGDLCPQCGAPGLVMEEGCAHCVACDFAKC
jgi:ribonucleoside-diphosphate reductase alpha chain